MGVPFGPGGRAGPDVFVTVNDLASFGLLG